MPEVTEAYVLGLLADLEHEVPRLEEQLAREQKRADAVDAELTALLTRLDASRTALRDAQHLASRAGVNIGERNMRVATLHQEIAHLKKRSDDVKTEMDRVGPGAIHRKLRRERAKVTVQIEDREQEIEDVRADVDRLHAALQSAEKVLVEERDRSRVLTAELDKLQSQLPSPYLYTRLFEATAARAHCNLQLDRDANAWRAQMARAIGWVRQLHLELRAGKYRLDKNSELVGGRSMATAEALYGAVALGKKDTSIELFELVTDPGLFFHQIFNVFRVWALGLYLTGRGRELRDLLRVHQYSEGLRGGYAHAFIGLLTRDRRRVGIGIKDIAKHEWELWQDPSLVRGAGVVNLGAVALARLAEARQLGFRVPGPTVPEELLPSSLRKRRETQVGVVPRRDRRS